MNIFVFMVYIKKKGFIYIYWETYRARVWHSREKEIKLLVPQKQEIKENNFDVRERKKIFPLSAEI